MAIELVLRWVHIFSAIALFGGGLYTRFVLLPAVETLGDEPRREFLAAVRSRWSRIVMVTSGLLLISGLVNYVLLRPTISPDAKFYHPVLGVKMMLALIVFFLAAALAGRSALAEKLRKNLRFWLSVTLLLGAVVVALGGVAKFAERVPAVSANVSRGR